MRGQYAELGGESDEWYRTPLGRYNEREQWRLIIQALQLPPESLVVDAGAGTGRFAQFLAQDHQMRVIAVEHSLALRSLGENRTENLPVEWRDGEPTSLPVGDSLADAVVITGVLEFSNDISTVWDEAARVLRPGGRVVIGVLTSLSPWAAFYRYLGGKGVAPWRDARLWTRDELAGFMDIPEDRILGAIHLAPSAKPPFEDAEEAGLRAGNRSAFLVGWWQKPDGTLP